MVEHHPVHNSEVYLLGLPARPSVPPPSPPSPLTPTDAGSGTPIEHLCLGGTELSAEVDEAASTARRRVTGAIHVLNTEATALQSLTQLYKTDVTAAEGFNAAAGAIAQQCRAGGKLVVTGVGKSGHIGKKLVATFNSLGAHSTFLHPTEALHGDLGKVGRHDAVLFITFSGKTSELLALLPHIDVSLPVIVLTAHRRPADCELIRQRPGAILLPALIHEPETISFGISAPTTSTTVALALGDALAVVVSHELHSSVSSVFAQNHPGGAIGASFLTDVNDISSSAAGPVVMHDLAVPIADVTCITGSMARLTGADVLKAGYGSPSGWVGLVVGSHHNNDDVIALACPARIRRLDVSLLTRSLADLPDLLVPRGAWIVITADTRATDAARWVRDLLVAPAYGEDSVLAIVDDAGCITGVWEAGELLRWRDV